MMEEFTILEIPYSSGRIRGIIEIRDNTNGNTRHKEWKMWDDGFSDKEDVIDMLKRTLIEGRKI